LSKQQVTLAHQFEQLVKTDKRFEITYPVIMGLVTFRLKVIVIYVSLPIQALIMTINLTICASFLLQKGFESN